MILGPSRPLPRVGSRARIAHFGGSFEPATVIGVLEHGRRLVVRAQGGETLEFVLHPATARFTTGSTAGSARLELLDRA